MFRARAVAKDGHDPELQATEAPRNHTRDLMFSSDAAPRQRFQFWSLVQILDDQLFANSGYIITAAC